MMRVLMWLVVAMLLAQIAGCGSGSSMGSRQAGAKIIRELREAEPSISPQAKEAAELSRLRLPAADAARIEAVCKRFEPRLLRLVAADESGRGPSKSTLASGVRLRGLFRAQIQKVAAAAGAPGRSFSHSVEVLLRKEIAWADAYPISRGQLSVLEGDAAETAEALRAYRKRRVAAGIARCNF
jgi:hypothetical protein